MSRRSNPTRKNRLMRGMLAIALSCACVAVAHPLSVIRGEVRGIDGGVELLVDLPRQAHDANIDRLASDRWRIVDAIAEHLYVYDVRGDRLSPVRAGIEEQGEGRATLLYAPGGDMDVLTLRLSADAGPALHGAQLALHSSADCTVQVAAGGSAAILPLEDGAKSDGRQIDLPEASVVVAPDGVGVEVRMPLSLLETWAPVVRESPGALRGSEAIALVEAVRDLFDSRLDVVIDGAPTALVFDDVSFLDPGGEVITSSGAFWGSSVRARAQVTTDTGIQSLAIEWRLFSAAVARGRVLVTVRGETAQRDVSRSAPAVRWSAQSGFAH